MKRYIAVFILEIVLIILTIWCFIGHEDKKDKIVVAEVTHSVFYAPWYVALNNGYFENLDIEVILTSGANNVISAVLSGDANIGLCGAEATIYVNDELNDKIKSFAALTKRDGQFLVLRNDITYNEFSDLNGKTILAGRAGGMPLLSFTTALKKKGINNVTIDSSIDFANLTSAFIAGNGDGVNLFEPNATKLVQNGYGYIATMIGTHSGIVPYTTFNAKESYIKNHTNELKIFFDGINKGLNYVHNHSAKEIANIIRKEFPDTKIEDLEIMIQNYKENDSLFTTSDLSKESFNNLENMLIDNNEIKNKYKFNDLVYEFN